MTATGASTHHNWTSAVEQWTDAHTALLDALRAEEWVPRFVGRLTHGRGHATAQDIWAMRDWAHLLFADAEGLAVRHMIELPSAWPDHWLELGESLGPRLTHHHALFYSTLATRAASHRRFDEAERLLRWSMRAWCHLIIEFDYLDTLVKNVSPDTPVDAGAPLRDEFEKRIDDARSLAARALATSSVKTGDIDREAAGHAIRVLDAVFGDALVARTFPTTAEEAKTARVAVIQGAIRSFDTALDELDFASADSRDLVRPWQWLMAVRALLEFSASVDAELISRLLDLLWTLRRLDRDRIDAFGELIELLRPAAENLENELRTGQFLGHNSRCADYLVFAGERESGDGRTRAFERALEICPGHRNSLKLLSYEQLEEADQPIYALAALPSSLSRIKATQNKAIGLRDKAYAAIKKAESTFPFNEDLESYRTRLKKECTRLKIPMEFEENDPE